MTAQRKSAHKEIVCVVFGVLLLALGSPAEAQQPKKIPRIGFLATGSGVGTPNPPNTEAFRRGLRELGYVEGKNILVEYRYAEGKPERIPSLAAELVQLKPDVLVVGSLTAIRAAKQASKTLPIVMVTLDDPVATGLIDSLAHPGGNITGLSTLSPELGGKQLEPLKEIVPSISRLSVLGTSTSPGNAQALKETEVAAGALGIKFSILRRT